MTKPPDIWLVGCCQSLERRGFDPKAALVEAVRIWREQEELERQYLATHRPDPTRYADHVKHGAGWKEWKPL